MAVSYRYLVCDLLTDSYIADLPLQGVRFDHRINEAGTFSGQMPIPNRRVSDLVNRAIPRDSADLSAGPGRIVCHVLRTSGMSTDLWGSYWIWRARVSQGRKGPPQLDVQGMSLDGYMQAVEIQTTFTRTATDRITIARDLLTDMQAQPYAGLGIQFPAGTCGVTQDLVVKPGDKTFYGAQLQGLAEQNNGFEYRLDTRLQPGGQRLRELTWGFPRLGEIDTSHDFAQPGAVLEWSQEIDASRGGTRWRARGDSVSSDITSESVPLTSPVIEATDHLGAGWPRIDRTVDYPGEKSLTNLESYAVAWAASAPGAVRIHTATVRVRANPSLTPHHLGDYARLRLVNQRYPRVNGVASFVRSWRVIGMEITPPQRSDGIEQAQLIFEELVT